ncbi:MAG: hypothetical protein JRL30_27095 [Deltaproteobacteria bacterium]|nr:hypothetical protein [Deltaproteobacteria bacterium]
MDGKADWRKIREARLPPTKRTKIREKVDSLFSNLLSRKWEVKTQHNHIGNITAICNQYDIWPTTIYGGQVRK